MPTISLEIDGETPDSVTLTALTRQDTGGPVPGVTLPAAFTFANGAWDLTFVEPSEGLTYDFTYRVTWDDGTFEDYTDSVEGTASATYGTRGGTENIYGRDDVTAWADANNNGDAGEIAARNDWAHAKAYRWINRRLRKAGMTAPATAENFQEFDTLADAEDEMAGVYLYESRGLTDQGVQADRDGVMRDHRKAAEDMLADAIETSQAADADDATAPAGTFQSVRINRGTSCPRGEFTSY
jgi:hypothetical protein